MNIQQHDLLEMTSNIVSAHLAGNTVAVGDVPTLIMSVHGALSGLAGGKPVAEKQEPAVPINKSIKPDYIICLEDGRKLKMLRRHLRQTFNMTPEEYRAKWGLPSNYPMVAANYSERRRGLAITHGLGRKPAVN